jgi:hypothetical protein
MPYHQRHHTTGTGHRLASRRTLLMLSVLLTYTAGPWLTVLDRFHAPHAGHHAALQPLWV